MGREATCEARWGAGTGTIHLHLDRGELAVRGIVRAHLPTSALRDVRAAGDTLSFSVDGESVALALGDRVAARWATALLAEPPSLAQKLGIAAGTSVATVGDPPAELGAAIATGTHVVTGADVLVAIAAEADALERALEQFRSDLDRGAPIWIVYRKGRTSAFGETAVRERMRGAAMTDTKVASVSAEWTAARFIRARGKR